MKRFWCRFLQPTADYRPRSYPPGALILGWWCSGYSHNTERWPGPTNIPTLVAFVKASSVAAVTTAVLEDWPEAQDVEVHEVPAGWAPGDRFPLSTWMAERIRGAA